MRAASLLFLVILNGCHVTEAAIENKELYCSEIYQGARSVARAAGNIFLGTGGIPDICETIDEVTAEKKSPETSM